MPNYRKRDKSSRIERGIDTCSKMLMYSLDQNNGKIQTNLITIQDVDLLENKQLTKCLKNTYHFLTKKSIMVGHFSTKENVLLKDKGFTSSRCSQHIHTLMACTAGKDHRKEIQKEYSHQFKKYFPETSVDIHVTKRRRIDLKSTHKDLQIQAVWKGVQYVNKSIHNQTAVSYSSNRFNTNSITSFTRESFEAALKSKF